MADLIVISDQASKSIREQLYPTLAENAWRTSGHPVLQMLGMEDKASDRSEPVVRPRVKPVQVVGAGRQIEVVHEYSLYGGGYCVSEDTSLTYGKRTDARSLATIRFYEGAFKISRADIAATRSNDFALVQEVSRHAQNALRQTQKDLGRMTCYLGNGILAYVNSAVTASTVVNVDNGGTEEQSPVRYLNISRKVLIGTSGQITGGTADEAEIANWTDRNTVTITGAGTFADNDLIVSKGVYSGSAYREFETLSNHINNTGTIQNVNKATNYWFASDVTSSVGTLALSDVDTAMLEARNFASSPEKAFMIAGQVVWRRYSDLLTANKRLQTMKSAFDGVVVGGVSGIEHYSPDGVHPVMLCTDVPDQTMFGLYAESFFWAEMHPLTFEDTGMMNGLPGQRITGSTNYEFPFLMYGQFVNTNARACFRLNGITA